MSWNLFKIQVEGLRFRVFIVLHRFFHKLDTICFNVALRLDDTKIEESDHESGGRPSFLEELLAEALENEDEMFELEPCPEYMPSSLLRDGGLPDWLREVREINL